MQSHQLEELDRGLHEALRLLERDEGRHGGHLALEHPAVRAAETCELMLPETLTAASLADAIRHKIDTVQVLLARARAHESLPEDAQLAADEGYLTATDGVPPPEQRRV